MVDCKVDGEWKIAQRGNAITLGLRRRRCLFLPKVGCSRRAGGEKCGPEKRLVQVGVNIYDLRATKLNYSGISTY